MTLSIWGRFWVVFLLCGDLEVVFNLLSLVHMHAFKSPLQPSPFHNQGRHAPQGMLQCSMTGLSIFGHAALPSAWQTKNRVLGQML